MLERANVGLYSLFLLGLPVLAYGSAADAAERYPLDERMSSSVAHQNSDCPENPLTALQFKNSGVVLKSMSFTYLPRPCYYVEDVDQWSTPWGPDGTSSYRYLYEVSKPGQPESPPTGVRSALRAYARAQTEDGYIQEHL